ncbi:hypothetical protein HanRHA438_Chr06g0263731 [Helianthus annuus]|nr:hypothetical protein HanRHA438_Chr06g0263731 [Helianthus annuus]
MKRKKIENKTLTLFINWHQMNVVCIQILVVWIVLILTMLLQVILKYYQHCLLHLCRHFNLMKHPVILDIVVVLDYEIADKWSWCKWRKNEQYGNDQPVGQNETPVVKVKLSLLSAASSLGYENIQTIDIIIINIKKKIQHIENLLDVSLGWTNKRKEL